MRIVEWVLVNDMREVTTCDIPLVILFRFSIACTDSIVNSLITPVCCQWK